MKKLLLILLFTVSSCICGSAVEHTMTIDVTSNGYRINGGSEVKIEEGGDISDIDFADRFCLVKFDIGANPNKQNVPRFYNSLKVGNFRIHDYNTIKVTVPSEFTITKAVFTTHYEDTATDGGAVPGTGTLSGYTWTWLPDEATDEFTYTHFTNMAAAYFTKFVITYEAPDKKEPGLIWVGPDKSDIKDESVDLAYKTYPAFVACLTDPEFDRSGITYTAEPEGIVDWDTDDLNTGNGLLHLQRPGTVKMTANFPGNDKYYDQKDLSFNLTVYGTCAEPVYDPVPGTYGIGQKVTITCPTPDAVITATVGSDTITGEPGQPVAYRFAKDPGTFTLKTKISSDGYIDRTSETKYIVEDTSTGKLTITVKGLTGYTNTGTYLINGESHNINNYQNLNDLPADALSDGICTVAIGVGDNDLPSTGSSHWPIYDGNNSRFRLYALNSISVTVPEGYMLTGASIKSLRMEGYCEPEKLTTDNGTTWYEGEMWSWRPDWESAPTTGFVAKYTTHDDVQRRFDTGLINVTYTKIEDEDVTGIDDLPYNASTVTVSVNHGIVSIYGAGDEDEARVYDIYGRLLHQGTSKQFELTAKGFMIIEVAGKSYKFRN